MYPAETDGRPNPLRGVSTRTRLLVAIGVVAFTALLPQFSLWLYLIPAGVVAALWILCRMPLGFAFKRLAIAQAFMLGLGVLWLVSPSSGPVFLSAFVKSNLCIITLLLLTWTTPFHELLQQLRRWSFPAVMLTTLALMYRYLPVLGDETRRMTRARASRTFNHPRWRTWNSLAEIIAQLFLRTAARAERIYLAMVARGWK